MTVASPKEPKTRMTGPGKIPPFYRTAWAAGRNLPAVDQNLPAVGQNLPAARICPFGNVTETADRAKCPESTFPM